MARNFASDTDALTDIVTDHYTMPSGPYSVGCWFRQTAFNNTRDMIHLNKWGANNSVHMGGVDFGAGDTRCTLNNGFGTTEDVFVSNFGTYTADSTWRCWIGTTDGATTPSTTSTSMIYRGDLSTSMADFATSSGGNNQTGSGTRASVIGATRLVLGNYWNVNAAVRGDLAQCFIVPYRMSQAQCESFRLGNWDVLLLGGTPVFFYPLNSSNLTDYNGNTLSATGTTVVADPNAGAFSSSTPSATGPRTNMYNPGNRERRFGLR